VTLDQAHKEAERVCRDITASARKASDRAMRPKRKRSRA